MCGHGTPSNTDRHPFSNYWTLTGGLGEVVSVLPSKEQADILINKYFDSVDPIYPLLHQSTVFAQYEAFWQLSLEEKAQVDSSFLALLFIMFSMGTQPLRLPGDWAAAQESQSSGAEFYASACHQALRIGAYLNRASIRALQAMVLMTYFMMNANHASDAWAFAGIIIRQAYATGLNRDPSLLGDHGLTKFDKQERKRLWIAIVCQDAFMSVILKPPPGATHADIDRAAPVIEGTTDSAQSNNSVSSEGDRSNDHGRESEFDSKNDMDFVNTMYTLALLLQETISLPASLSLPLASTPRHRSQLLNRFRSCYRSLPDIYRARGEASILKHGNSDVSSQRKTRQMLFLRDNYWHCVMLIHLEACEVADGPHAAGDQIGTLPHVKGTLEAAHEALTAFFVLNALLNGEAGTWWVMAHRAFTAAVGLLCAVRFIPFAALMER